MAIDRVAALDDPQLRAFAPLIYVAWSDFDLEPEDRARVLTAMASQPWLRPAARAVLDAWLEAPASAGELSGLRNLIDHVAATSSDRAKESFARVARSAAADGDARSAAIELSHDLGLFAPPEPPAEPAPAPAAAPGLAAFLDGDHADVRARAREFLATARTVYGLPVAEHRTIVRGWLHELAATGLPRLAFPRVTSIDDLAAFSALFEELAHGDLSLLVKVGVQYGLYGGAVWALGTARHHARLAEVASNGELGCFAMSEVGHG
ncbi:MAG TPA: hypothetical protein VIV58_21480, partial [Kofleriaceae bacterium]